MSASVATRKDCKREVAVLSASHAPQYNFTDSKLEWMKHRAGAKREGLHCLGKHSFSHCAEGFPQTGSWVYTSLQTRCLQSEIWNFQLTDYLAYVCYLWFPSFISPFFFFFFFNFTKPWHQNTYRTVLSRSVIWVGKLYQDVSLHRNRCFT